MLFAPLTEAGVWGLCMKFRTEGLEDYISDSEVEVEGIWVDFGSMRIKIRRAGGGNREYERALARRAQPFQRRIRAGTMDNAELREKIILPTYLDAVVLDWRGAVDEDGEVVPYTREAGKVYFNQFPNILDDLVAISTDIRAFREQQRQETADLLGES